MCKIRKIHKIYCQFKFHPKPLSTHAGRPAPPPSRESPAASCTAAHRTRPTRTWWNDARATSASPPSRCRPATSSAWTRAPPACASTGRRRRTPAGRRRRRPLRRRPPSTSHHGAIDSDALTMMKTGVDQAPAARRRPSGVVPGWRTWLDELWGAGHYYTLTLIWEQSFAVC